MTTPPARELTAATPAYLARRTAEQHIAATLRIGDKARNLVELHAVLHRSEHHAVVEAIAEDAPARASAHRVVAVGHAHIDTAWLWPLAETRRKARRTFSSVLGLMDRYAEIRSRLLEMRKKCPEPVIMLAIFGSVFGNTQIEGSGITFAQYFVAGMIARWISPAV